MFKNLHPKCANPVCVATFDWLGGGKLCRFHRDPKQTSAVGGSTGDLDNSHHVEQAYSYAIHPEVRANLYALCNGRELVVYSVSKWAPILRVSLPGINEHWHLVEEALLPKFLLNPEIKGFMPDFGLAMLKIGVKPGTLQLIVLHHLQSVMRAEDDLYVFNTTTSVGDLEYLVTLDMSAALFNELLSGLPSHVADPISFAMKHAPYQMALDGKILITCAGHLSNVTECAHEEFAPIVVSEISKVIYDATVQLTPYEPRKAV